MVIKKQCLNSWTVKYCRCLTIIIDVIGRFGRALVNSSKTMSRPLENVVIKLPSFFKNKLLIPFKIKKNTNWYLFSFYCFDFKVKRHLEYLVIEYLEARQIDSIVYVCLEYCCNCRSMYNFIGDGLFFKNKYRK